MLVWAGNDCWMSIAAANTADNGVSAICMCTSSIGIGDNSGSIVGTLAGDNVTAAGNNGIAGDCTVGGVRSGNCLNVANCCSMAVTCGSVRTCKVKTIVVVVYLDWTGGTMYGQH